LKLLFDALSVNNLSGAYVLRGHLDELMTAGDGRHQVVLLTHRSNTRVANGVADGVQHVVADIGGGWLERAVWCQTRLAALCRTHRIDCVFSPAGMLSPGCRLPQIVLAQNPWPLVAANPDRGSWRMRLRATAFRSAQRRAAVMAFNSRYMRELYESAFGPALGQTVVAYQGLPESRLIGSEAVTAFADRPAMVLSVSVMARHKAVEVLVSAFAEAARLVEDATLVIVGAWPDAAYRRQIERLIHDLNLGTRVEIRGHVTDEALSRLYASARAFCLTSRCESFGIPALEAQAYGTPCVVVDGTAAPEVLGEGGWVVPQDDASAAAQALVSLLNDGGEWQRRSRCASDNVRRFRWSDCARPLIDAIDGLALRLSTAGVARP